MKKATEVEILRREYEMLRQDLQTHKDHQARIVCAGSGWAERFNCWRNPRAAQKPESLDSAIIVVTPSSCT